MARHGADEDGTARDSDQYGSYRAPWSGRGLHSQDSDTLFNVRRKAVVMVEVDIIPASGRRVTDRFLWLLGLHTGTTIVQSELV